MTFRIPPKWLFLLALCCGALPAWGQVRPIMEIEVRVLPRAEVFGESFTLGEIAEMDGVDISVLQRLAQVRIGSAPLPGKSLALSESLIRSRLAGAKFGKDIKLFVPRRAQVVRVAQMVPGSVVARLVLEQGRQDTALSGKDELKQEIITHLRDIALPKGQVKWNVRLMGDHIVAGGTRIYKVRALVDGREAWSGAVRLRQKIYRKIVVAKRPIGRNKKISQADLILVRRNVSGNRGDPYLASLSEVVGRLARRPIGKNESVHKTMLSTPADVPEGGRVIVVYESGTLLLRAPGVALVKGRAGQFIPVRNLQSGKIVYGVLGNDETVKVN